MHELCVCLVIIIIIYLCSYTTNVLFRIVYKCVSCAHMSLSNFFSLHKKETTVLKQEMLHHSYGKCSLLSTVINCGFHLKY